VPLNAFKSSRAFAKNKFVLQEEEIMQNITEGFLGDP
jgi:hypothetical protein